MNCVYVLRGINVASPMSNQSMSTFWGQSVSIPAGEYTSGCERYSKASSELEDMHDILLLDLLKMNC